MTEAIRPSSIMGEAGGPSANQDHTQPQRVTAPQPTPAPQQAGALRFSNLEELEGMAKLKLTANAYNYYASGAGAGETVAENRDALQRLRLLPRIMVDVSAVDTSVTLLGELAPQARDQCLRDGMAGFAAALENTHAMLGIDGMRLLTKWRTGRKFSMPIFVAPMAMQRMAHPDGELAVACACSAVGTCMVRHKNAIVQVHVLYFCRHMGGGHAGATGQSISARKTWTCPYRPPQHRGHVGSAVVSISHVTVQRRHRKTLPWHPQGVSTMGTTTLEDVAAASDDPGTLMFQLYVLRDREFTRDVVQVSCLLYS